MKVQRLMFCGMFVLGAVSLAANVYASCCNLKWEYPPTNPPGNGPCSGTATLVCEKSSPAGTPGRPSQDLRLARCYTYTGQFARLGCSSADKPGPGWDMMPGTLDDLECCWWNGPAPTYTDRNFLITPCEGALCTAMPPGDGGN